jgi:Ca2+-binding RTX toxin-like protein
VGSVGRGEEKGMRRVALVLTAMALALVLASGVALAVNKVGTNGPDTLRGTNKADNLLGRGANDILLALAGNDNLLGGPGKDIVYGGDENRQSGGNKNMVGGSGNDSVIGGRGSDIVLGEEGDDLVVDGPDREFATDNVSGGDGNDVVGAVNRPAFVDIVSCGGGFDRVIVDRKDVLAPDCEKVFFGLGSEDEFIESIPQSFFEGLHPQFTQFLPR